MATGRKFGWHSGTLTCQDIKAKGDIYVQDDIVFSDVSAGTLGVTGGIDMSSSSGDISNIILGGYGRISTETAAAEGMCTIDGSFSTTRAIELRYGITAFSGSEFIGAYIRAEAKTNAATAKSLYGAQIYGTCNNVTMTTGSLWGTLVYAYVKGVGAVTINNMYAVQGELTWDASRTGDCTITTAAACFRAKITGGRVADYTKIHGYELTIGEMDGDSQRFGYGIYMQDDAGMSGTSTLTKGIYINIGCTTGIELAGVFTNPLVIGTSGVPLNYTATTSSSSGIQVHLTSDYAGEASSMKGADIRVAKTAGIKGSLIGVQIVSAKTGGDTITAAKDHWGLNTVVNQSGSTAKTPNVYGVVGDLTIDGTVTLGASGGAHNIATAGWFRSYIASGVTVTNLDFDAPIIAQVRDGVTEAEDRAKATAGVLVLLGGDSGYSVTGGAAFKHIRQNTTDANRFDYGLDLYYSSGSLSNMFTTADIRLSSAATITSGSGAPSSTQAEGSVYFRTDLTGGSAGSAVYLNTDGATNWVALT